MIRFQKDKIDLVHQGFSKNDSHVSDIYFSQYESTVKRNPISEEQCKIEFIKNKNNSCWLDTAFTIVFLVENSIITDFLDKYENADRKWLVSPALKGPSPERFLSDYTISEFVIAFKKLISNLKTDKNLISSCEIRKFLSDYQVYPSIEFESQYGLVSDGSGTIQGFIFAISYVLTDYENQTRGAFENFIHTAPEISKNSIYETCSNIDSDMIWIKFLPSRISTAPEIEDFIPENVFNKKGRQLILYGAGLGNTGHYVGFFKCEHKWFFYDDVNLGFKEKSSLNEIYGLLSKFNLRDILIFYSTIESLYPEYKKK